MPASAYLDTAVPHIDRLLSNIDRNRDSETFGCLCRPYWHDKVMDFPSAQQQIGVLPLAIVYGNHLSDRNPYTGDEQIAAYCRAGIQYWAAMQRENGSFDEHYPREHSLAATAWSLWAVTAAMEHLDTVPAVEDAIRNAVDFIGAHDEPGTIANHQAVTAAALFNADTFVDVDRALITERLDRVRQLQSPEGWFQEYRGADPGYHSTAIAHLARIWAEEPSLVDDQMLRDALDFFSAFIDAENYYGAGIGSRSTQHVHPTGFEILAETFDTAAQIASALRTHVADQRVLIPRVVDDKHFSWLQAEFLHSYLYATDHEKPSDRIASQRFRDILISCDEPHKTFVNLSKGGHTKRYRGGELVEEHPGVTTTISGETYTANWTGTTTDVDIGDNNQITIEGKLRHVPQNTLNGWRFLLMRLFQHTAGRFPSISLRLKDYLINRLITGGRSDFTFEREISLDAFTIQDRHDGERIQGKTRSMFIPNTEFFQTPEKQTPSDTAPEKNS